MKYQDGVIVVEDGADSEMVGRALSETSTEFAGGSDKGVKAGAGE